MFTKNTHKYLAQFFCRRMRTRGTNFNEEKYWKVPSTLKELGNQFTRSWFLEFKLIYGLFVCDDFINNRAQYINKMILQIIHCLFLYTYTHIHTYMLMNKFVIFFPPLNTRIWIIINYTWYMRMEVRICIDKKILWKINHFN